MFFPVKYAWNLHFTVEIPPDLWYDRVLTYEIT